MVSNKTFIATIILSAIIHLGAITMLVHFPKQQESKKTFKMMHVKLGKHQINTSLTSGNDAQNLVSLPQQPAKEIKAKDAVNEPGKKLANLEQPELPVGKLDKVKNEKPKKAEAKKKQKPSKKSVKTPAINKQEASSKKQAGNKMGNSKNSQKIYYDSYEAELLATLNSHKIYPETAIQKGIEGIGLVKIIVDRRGKIVERVVYQGTGYQVLDEELIAMIDRTPPIPVPDNYEPETKLFHLTVKIPFTLR